MSKRAYISVFLLMASIFAVPYPCNADDDAKDEPTVPEVGRSVPPLEIVFEKSELIETGFPKLKTINVTLINNLDSFMNISLSGRWNILFLPDGSQSINLFSSVVPILPFEKILVQYNLSLIEIRHYEETFEQKKTAFISDVNISGSNATERAFCSNSTKVSYINPYSLDIVAPSNNECTYFVNKGDNPNLIVNVTNHSDTVVSGVLSINGGKIRQPMTLNVRMTEHYKLRIYPSEWGANETKRDDWYVNIVLSFETNDSITPLGYTLVNNMAMNAKRASLRLIFIDMLKIDAVVPNFQVDVPDNINISILLTANRTLTNLRCKIIINGYFDEKIHHDGFFIIQKLEPYTPTTISYRVLPNVAGGYLFEIVTNVFGLDIRFSSHITIKTNINIQNNLRQIAQDMDGKAQCGSKIHVQGYIENKYQYPLKNVNVTIFFFDMNIHGILSREDFATVEPDHIMISILNSGDIEEFGYDITFNSPGKYRIAVTVFWDNNVTPGGELPGVGFRIFRLAFNNTQYWYVLLIPMCAIVPKLFDLVVRHRGKIPFW